jgi:virginiamycin B lyase
LRANGPVVSAWHCLAPWLRWLKLRTPGAAGITTGPDGQLWFSESNANKIVRAVVPARPPTVANFPPLGGGIALGPDGALWFVGGGDELTVDNIGRITTTGGSSLYPIPTVGFGGGSIVAGSDGALWFTETYNNKIGRITTAGSITEYPLSPIVNYSGSSLGGIASGPDGALWFAENTANMIGRITTDGIISEYLIPTSRAFPTGITLGPDGALWFTEFVGKIGRITTDGAITEYVIPSEGGGPVEITAGPDGAFWFIEYDANKIGRITTSGTITEFMVPTPDSGLSGIAAGPDGALWFAESHGLKEGRITTGGTITEYESDGVPVGPGVAGPDGALWFEGIIRLSLPAASTLNAVKIIGTNPPGLTVTVDGIAYIAPQTFTWPVGTQHTISAPSAASVISTPYSFANWSDMQPQSHTITANASPNVYIANYK